MGTVVVFLQLEQHLRFYGECFNHLRILHGCGSGRQRWVVYPWKNHRVSIVAYDSRVEVFLLVSTVFGDFIWHRRRDQRYGVGGYFTSRRHVRVRRVGRDVVRLDRPHAF